MRAVKEKANAKINLYLDVIARREDGFHDIKTVMHSISFADEITVIANTASVRSVRMSVRGNRFLPVDERNLAVKAANLFLDVAGVNASIEMKLEKRIPVAAGLAGGSTDAAATLRAMNRLFGRMFSERVLYKMAAELGSDVPYCLYGKTALCEGRGDIITKLPDKLKMYFVVAVADERVSTPKAYSRLDSMYSSFDGSVPTGGDKIYNSLIESLEIGMLSDGSLFNVFESAVLPMCKGASMIKGRMIELGATASLMSGSGPSVFGVFKTYEDAERAATLLRGDGVRAYCASSV